MTTDALKKLHTAMLDTRDGYEKAAEDAHGADLKALFVEMIALRTKDHAEIHQALSAAGEEPSDGKSFMATIHKTAVDIRSAVTGIDRAALAPFIKGEESILQHYDDAIGEADSSTAVMLKRQKVELLNKVEAMQAMQR